MARDKIQYQRPSESKDILFRWWQHILLQCKITDLAKYSQLVTQWINNPIYGIPKDPKRQSTYRGNLNKEHWRGTMTWKVFLKALSVIGVERIEFNIRLFRSEQSDAPVVDTTFTIDNLPNYVANTLKEESENTGGYERVTPVTAGRYQRASRTSSYSQINAEPTPETTNIRINGVRLGESKES